MFLLKQIEANHFGISYIGKDICDYVSIDWHTSIFHAREILNNEIGIQGNMDPRIFYEDYKKIETYLNTLTNFGNQNFDWIFNLGHGILPETNPEMVENLIKIVKNN